jgi:S1-C subfamily serine protease
MKSLILTAIMSAGIYCGNGQSAATSEILMRIFRISYPNTNTHATCFAIDVDDRQYLVTARHVVAGIKSNDVVRLFHQSRWKDLPVRYLECPNTNADVAVLIPPFRLSNAGQIDVTSSGMFIGEEVNFLGFPFGLFTEGREATGDLPIPFVKRGIISGWDNEIIWLDGINNPGFSGGPVVVNVPGSRRKQIIGIVSGFLSVEEAVKYRGQPTNELRSVNNTGLIKCWGIQTALEAIRQCPAGPTTK